MRSDIRIREGKPGHHPVSAMCRLLGVSTGGSITGTTDLCRRERTGMLSSLR